MHQMGSHGELSPDRWQTCRRCCLTYSPCACLGRVDDQPRRHLEQRHLESFILIIQLTTARLGISDELAWLTQHGLVVPQTSETACCVSNQALDALLSRPEHTTTQKKQPHEPSVHRAEAARNSSRGQVMHVVCQSHTRSRSLRTNW
jgi:hypothetical protein